MAELFPVPVAMVPPTGRVMLYEPEDRFIGLASLTEVLYAEPVHRVILPFVNTLSLSLAVTDQFVLEGETVTLSVPETMFITPGDSVHEDMLPGAVTSIVTGITEVQVTPQSESTGVREMLLVLKSARSLIELVAPAQDEIS